jgi:antitoxin (DNA-binding transcriptional repressor) of toxin-antitoxin stability system
MENGKPVLIKRHGEPVAAIVKHRNLANLERLRKTGPEGGLASLTGGWEGSEELSSILEE